MTAVEVMASRIITPRPPSAPPPKNRPVIAGQRAAANTAMTARALALWVREAARGMLVRLVRDSAAGRTPSRDSANMYRQVTL